MKFLLYSFAELIFIPIYALTHGMKDHVASFLKEKAIDSAANFFHLLNFLTFSNFIEIRYSSYQFLVD
jgi:hypothetical protein